MTTHEHAWFMRKTKDAGRLVSTVDYVTNLAVKHQGLIQKISLSLGELVEDDAAVFGNSLAKECSTFAETMEADAVTFLTEDGVGGMDRVPSSELRGTADCRSKLSVATNNIDKFRVIFDSGLEDLFSARDVFSDDWNELPSHPLPAAGTPPHQIAHTHDSAGLPTGYHSPSIATYSGSVKDDYAMGAKDRAGLTADHYV
ncbi:hypothetical protein ARMGADRAFT_1130405 [Armillaria gallica]|uniref:Uncharacterized protein n=1 Tax=Armillaria gallica TaxID=47427 RepID=A0A2H3DX06_ARMGA|nr:hypothetical protein ARMGADRAFT_1130405 [Armillaria gallica]